MMDRDDLNLSCKQPCVLIDVMPYNLGYTTL